jgi:hypothetical protein
MTQLSVSHTTTIALHCAVTSSLDEFKVGTHRDHGGERPSGVPLTSMSEHDVDADVSNIVAVAAKLHDSRRGEATQRGGRSLLR